MRSPWIVRIPIAIGPHPADTDARCFSCVGESGAAVIPTLRLLHFEIDGNVLVVVPLGDCSSLEAAVLEEELRAILAQVASSGVTGLIIDLEQAPYFGSTMLGGLIKLWRSMKLVQGRLVLCNVSANEHDVLNATRLDSVWDVYPTRAAALEALR